NRLHVIGNLPFNISTPLLVQWMKMLSKRSGIFQISNITMTLMFQKEVGDRIVADTFSPVRSRLSVLVQSLCEAKKVDAALIQLIALKEPILNVPIDQYEMVVRYFFGQRRKTIQSLLKALTKKLTADEVDRLIKGLEQLDINLSLRPEKLTSEQFCRVTKAAQIRTAIKDVGIKFIEYSSLQDITPVGRGGFGEIFKAFWPQPGITVALKCIDHNNDPYKAFIKE
ncbi:3998_t:CDS:2, partial [Gigaspora rosea]